MNKNYSNRARWCIVRYPESDCRGGWKKIAKKPASHINYGGGGALQLRLTWRRATLFGGGGVAHSRLVTAEFGGSEV